MWYRTWYLTGLHTRLLSKNAPTNDRNNTFETVMNILGNLGPEYSDLVYIVTQPLIAAFYVSWFANSAICKQGL